MEKVIHQPLITRPGSMLAALFSMLLFIPTIVLSDQNNPELEPLFDTLKQSSDQAELSQIEAKIWSIWFESGDSKIDELMENGSEAAARGMLDAAEKFYDEVVTTAPEFSEGWNRRATIRFYRNDYDGSLADIRQTLVLEPRHYGAIWGLGMILGLKQEYEAAITAFEQLLAIKPSSQGIDERIRMLREALAKSAV